MTTTLTLTGTLLPLASKVETSKLVALFCPPSPNAEALAEPRTVGTFVGLAMAMQPDGIDRCQDTRKSPRVGSVTDTLAFGRDEVTCPSERI